MSTKYLSVHKAYTWLYIKEHWLDGETLNQKEKLLAEGHNSYLLKKLEPRFADSKFGFLHKIT